MSRGVGYCENIACDKYGTGVFVMNQDTFHCQKCRHKGLLEKERYEYANDFPVIREVRVEFDYDPLARRYRLIAVVCDDELGGHCNVLTVFSPLCETNKRGLKLAELYFAYISLNGVGVKNLDSTQNIVDLDAPREVVLRQCQEIGKKWADAATVRKTGLPLEATHG